MVGKPGLNALSINYVIVVVLVVLALNDFIITIAISVDQSKITGFELQFTPLYWITDNIIILLMQLDIERLQCRSELNFYTGPNVIKC